MQRFLSVATRFPRTATLGATRQFSAAPAQSEFGVYPREREGNIYSVNWSLAEHGVVPIGDAYRNAKIPTLEKKLGTNTSSTSKFAIMGKYNLEIAGEGITHGDFSNLIEVQREFLSSGVELFVEDASVGSVLSGRQGVRIVSDSPAMALIARNLLVSLLCYHHHHYFFFYIYTYTCNMQRTIFITASLDVSVVQSVVICLCHKTVKTSHNTSHAVSREKCQNRSLDITNMCAVLFNVFLGCSNRSCLFSVSCPHLFIFPFLES